MRCFGPLEIKAELATTLGQPTRLAKVVFSGLRRAAGGLLARRGGLGGGARLPRFLRNWERAPASCEVESRIDGRNRVKIPWVGGLLR